MPGLPARRSAWDATPRNRTDGHAWTRRGRRPRPGRGREHRPGDRRPGRGNGGPAVRCGVAVLQDAGQQLDSNQQGDGRPAGDDPTDSTGADGGDVGGQARGGADDEGGPGQASGPAAGAAVGEQDEGRDDLHAVDGEGEGVSVSAGVAVGGGELAHVAVADGACDAGQPGYRGRCGSADPLVGPLRAWCRAAHFAALGVRDLRKRTGSGSPSMRMGWIAWRDVRPTHSDVRFLSRTPLMVRGPSQKIPDHHRAWPARAPVTARSAAVMPACGGMHSMVDCRAELDVRRGNNWSAT